MTHQQSKIPTCIQINQSDSSQFDAYFIYGTKLPHSQDIKLCFSMLLGNSSSSLSFGYRELFLYFSVNSACFSFFVLPLLVILSNHATTKSPPTEETKSQQQLCVASSLDKQLHVRSLLRTLVYGALGHHGNAQVLSGLCQPSSEAWGTWVQKIRAMLVSPAHRKPEEWRIIIG